MIVTFNQYTSLKKSVSIWDSCGDLSHSHVWIIGAYCHYSTGFEPPQVWVVVCFGYLFRMHIHRIDLCIKTLLPIR